MFAYCNNNSVCFLDPTGYALCDVKNAVMNDGSSAYGANIAFLMAFFGVDSPDQVPELPDGAMIFVENIKSFSFYGGAGVVVGQTIVMDAHKYCEYTFIGVGFSYSKSIPLDVTVSQGYVYGVKEVSDYSGLFVGWAFNKLSSADGGAVALNKVYSQITGGMSYAVSLGGSVTWYSTSQTGWTYGRANMVILPNPYNTSPDGTRRSV